MNNLSAIVGADALAVQGVDYAADVLGFLEGGDAEGSQTMADLVAQVSFFWGFITSLGFITFLCSLRCLLGRPVMQSKLSGMWGPLARVETIYHPTHFALLGGGSARGVKVMSRGRQMGSRHRNIGKIPFWRADDEV